MDGDRKGIQVCAKLASTLLVLDSIRNGMLVISCNHTFLTPMNKL